MVGNLYNLEVCKCIRGKHCINVQYIQCMSRHDGDATRAAAAVSTRNDSEDLSRVPTRTVRHNTFAMDIIFHVYVSADI